MTAVPAGDFTLTFSHQIYYTNEKPVPAEEIAEALYALTRVVERSPRVLKKLIPGVSKAEARVFVDKLVSGSIREDIFITLIFNSKEEMEKTIRRVREKLGIDLNTKSGVIRAIVIGLLLVGASAAAGYSVAQLLSSETPPQKATVEVSHNTILSIGENSGLNGDQILKAIEMTVRNKNQLASDAVKVIKPAKRDPKAEIRFDNREELTIPQHFIAKVPSEVTTPENEKSDTKEHVKILIRAADMDKGTGWAAIVPTVSSKRLRLELAPNIDLEDLFGKPEITGTVEVLSSRDSHGKMQLRAYYLTSIDKD